MIVAIHQPDYIPYLGFFQKMLRADIFILYDTAQFSRNGFHNRNRIKTASGVHWLTVPVRRNGLLPIREVEIADVPTWAEKHLKSLEAAYRRAPYYATYGPEISAILSQEWQRLADLNSELIKQAARWLKIERRIVLASDLPPSTSSDPTEKILCMTAAVGGDTYLSGPAGRNYLDTSKFASIRLQFTDFIARPYPQLHGSFVENLSVVDAVLNCGLASRDLLTEAKGPSRESETGVGLKWDEEMSAR